MQPPPKCATSFLFASRLLLIVRRYEKGPVFTRPKRVTNPYRGNTFGVWKRFGAGAGANIRSGVWTGTNIRTGTGTGI